MQQQHNLKIKTTGRYVREKRDPNVNLCERLMNSDSCSLSGRADLLLPRGKLFSVRHCLGPLRLMKRSCADILTGSLSLQSVKPLWRDAVEKWQERGSIQAHSCVNLLDVLLETATKQFIHRSHWSLTTICLML